MDVPASKAAILHEALPYIRRFHGKTMVVKYGGHAMVDEALKESFARDVCLLRYIGIQVVVVHGGGPQINETLNRMGIESKFEGGLRVTDEETMDVVEMVLAGGVNSQIVGLICQHGGRAMGLSGRDDNFIVAEPMGALGRVGAIKSIEPRLVTNLIQNGFLPVIAPIAIDTNGKPLNVNADTAAGEVAAGLGAAKLVLMTDVGGVKNADGEFLSSLGAAEAKKLIADGVVRDGMVPKVECALHAVAEGVKKVHIVDGRKQHALLLEIFTDSGVGTEIHG
ncbi:MAG: acetylglutamate kinase [Polyangiaceae bacterium]|nr:acetylglutamate kinase [Polyangiaceae bacterium]